jgi:regulation of enolase protein 1 (concanavalin A-like superfamily)
MLSAVMLLSSVALVSSPASSDPVDINNPDDTHTLVWGFDNASDYNLNSASVGGGVASLTIRNETVAEDSQADFALGTRSNIDISTYPGSLVLDSTVESAATVTYQPISNGIDSYISEARPNDNFDGDSALMLDSEASKSFRILMQFDLSAIPSDAVVANATLLLYEVSGGKGNPVTFDVHPLTTAWSEPDATWNKYDMTNFWTTAGGDYDGYSYARGTVDNTVGWKSANITRLVEQWVRGTTANLGFIMVPVPAGGDALKVFQSSDSASNTGYSPKLVVDYLVPGASGAYESRALGPGTNSTFTSASWSDSSMSFLTDEFSGLALSSGWTWLNDPSADDGSYNVGVTRSGWLHVIGSSSTEILGTSVTANYLHETVTGDFTATTSLEDAFSAGNMGAGIMLMEDLRNWMYIAKADPSTSGKLQVTACEEGWSANVANIAWTGLSNAFLRVERNSTGFWMYSSADDADWTLIYHMAPTVEMAQRLLVGLVVYSASSSLPVVDFDYLRIEPAGAVAHDVMVRVGNSTDTADPSWGGWVPVNGSTAVVGEAGRYFQYRIYLETDGEWYTPEFQGITVHYERYGTSGFVETHDYVPSDFSMWYTLTTAEDDSGGRARYYYSTDRGATWIYAGTGGSYTIMSTQNVLRVRVSLESFDTLRTPLVDSVTVIYGTAIQSFYLVVPGTVVAGEAFAVTIYAKDSTNVTMMHWTGPVTLDALDRYGADEASGELSVSAVQITGGGYVTVPNEAYTVAETITIVASASGISGLSAPITVLPGPIDHIEVGPPVVQPEEFTAQSYTATAYDAHGNVVPDTGFAWTVSGGIGVLNTSSGASVTLVTYAAPAEGYLNVTLGGTSASLHITVITPAHAPVFTSSLPTQTQEEDSGSWTVDLRPYVEDEEHGDSELRWYMMNETLVSVTGENVTGAMTITLSTMQDLFGENVLTVVVVDPEGMASSTTLKVVITPVNDGPSIDPITPLVIHYDSVYLYNFRYYIHDVDTPYDNLTLSVDEVNAAYIEAQKLTLAFDYPESFNGYTAMVVVTVSDGELSSATIVWVTVSDDSVPILTEDLPDVTMYQGEVLLKAFDLDDHFMDPDQDILYFASGFEHIWVNITTDHWVNIFAPWDWSGDEIVVFSASDAEGARVEEAVTVTVLPVNQAPWIDGVPDLSVRFESRYEFDLLPYMGDPEDPMEQLVVTTDDTHIAVMGATLSMLYPMGMNGTKVQVRVTVSDGELSDSQTVNISISNDYPPEAEDLNDHSFMEDLPIPYPMSGTLEDYFSDPDGGTLTFEAFTWTELVTATAVPNGIGHWTVNFYTDGNFNGETHVTVRATDSEGAIAEKTILLTVISVADAPTLDVYDTFDFQQGVNAAVDLSKYIRDPDSVLAQMSFSITGNEDAQYIDVAAGMLLIEFPADFLDKNEDSRAVELYLTVMDQTGLMDTATVTVLVTKIPSGATSPLTLVAVLILAGVTVGSFAVAMGMRRKPFVIRDIMLVHNDGFLIGRHAAAQAGEIDEDILSGMLTAVLGFVEDSMASSKDTLRTFGFKEYQVMVKRGKKAYMAVVYEGDAPDNMDEALGEFMTKVERIYRKSLDHWTGDIESEYAGVELLLQGFVKEHTKRGRRNGKVLKLWQGKKPVQAEK